MTNPSETEMTAAAATRKWFAGTFPGTESDFYNAVVKAENAMHLQGFRAGLEAAAKVAEEIGDPFSKVPAAIRSRAEKKD